MRWWLILITQLLLHISYTPMLRTYWPLAAALMSSKIPHDANTPPSAYHAKYDASIELFIRYYFTGARTFFIILTLIIFIIGFSDRHITFCRFTYNLRAILLYMIDDASSLPAASIGANSHHAPRVYSWNILHFRARRSAAWVRTALPLPSA